MAQRSPGDSPFEQLRPGITTLDPLVTSDIWAIYQVSIMAELLYLRAAIHSARHGGFVALNALPLLTRGLPKPKAHVRELVEQGAWVEVEWGWKMDLHRTRHRCAPDNDRWKLTNALRLEVLERDNYECQACGATDRLVIDHKEPIARGGLTVFDNLQALCAPCNGSKGTKSWDDWLASR